MPVIIIQETCGYPERDLFLSFKEGAGRSQSQLPVSTAGKGLPVLSGAY